MASFKKGLMEFAEGFVLSAGATVAENIKVKAKQDRADILSTAKELKTRIQKNKAADTKAHNTYMQFGQDLIAVMPGIVDDPQTLRSALSSEAYRKQLLELANNDLNGFGDANWYTKIAKANGLPENFDPYAKSDSGNTLSRLVKQSRGVESATRPKGNEDAAAAADEQERTTESTIRTVFGAGMSPWDIIKTAETRLTGRGAFTPNDVERFGGAGYVPPLITSPRGGAPLPSAKARSASIQQATVWANQNIEESFTKEPDGVHTMPPGTVKAFMKREEVSRLTRYFTSADATAMSADAIFNRLEKSGATIKTSTQNNDTGNTEIVDMPISQYLNQPVNEKYARKVTNEKGETVPLTARDFYRKWIELHRRGLLKQTSARTNIDNTL